MFAQITFGRLKKGFGKYEPLSQNLTKFENYNKQITHFMFKKIMVKLRL